MKSERDTKLRRMAEELLKKQQSRSGLALPEENMLKLIHELQVHQIELELQNEELTSARQKEEQAKKKYAGLFEYAPSAYFILTSSGDIAELNQAGEKLLGKERPKLINSRFAFFVSPDTRNIFADFLSKVVSGSAENCEVAFESEAGVYAYAHLSGSLTNEGEMCMITADDITDRKRNELVMHIQNKIANSVQETDTIEHLLEITRTELGKLLDTSNFFVAMYEAEIDAFSKLISGDEKDALECPVWKFLSGHVVKTGETMLLKANEIELFARKSHVELPGAMPACWLGSPFTINKKIAGIMVVQSNDNPEAYNTADVALFELLAQATGTYIEKQKILKDLVTAKETAQQSDRLKSAFLANMSHEIRTPMNGILGFAELLKEPGLNTAQQQEYIQIIENSGSRMLNIINDIVDISKIEAGMMKLDIKESNIFDQINYIYTFFKPEVEARGIEFCYKNPLPEGELIIKTDREKLFAVLTNLVKNAIRFTDKGMIEIGYKKKSRALEFFVKDTGIGIPKDRQEAIFERFVQADIEDRAVRQGSGLGLAISRSYIEMLGGKIWVESEEGVGSTFYFTLPHNIKSATDAVVHQRMPAAKTYKGRKIKILIAEDDEFSEILLKTQIRAYSKKILKARTGREATEICRSNADIDMIMMDIRMPEMDGYEATRQIREFNKSVIIIAQTAYGLVGAREKAIAAGCNDYIAKPINKGELHAVMEKHLRN